MSFIQLDSVLHREFLSEGRKDPVCKELLVVGDKVVTCDHCKQVFLLESWELVKGEHEYRASSRLPVKELPPEILYFTADRYFLDDGNPVNLSWKLKGKATEFKLFINPLSGGTSRPLGVKHLNEIQFSPREDTRYELYVKKLLSPAQRASVVVEVSKVPPIIHHFLTDTHFLKSKQPVTLSWRVERFEKLFIYADYTEEEVTQIESRSLQVSPRKDTTYILRAVSHYDIPIEKKILISVDKTPPIILFSSIDTAVIQSFGTKLLWEVKGGEVITINNDIGIVSNRGTLHVDPEFTTTYTIEATSYFGCSTTQSVRIEVITIPDPKKFLQPEPQMVLASPESLMSPTFEKIHILEEIPVIPAPSLIPLLELE